MYYERNDIAESVDYRTPIHLAKEKEEKEIDTLAFRARGSDTISLRQIVWQRSGINSPGVQPDNDRYDWQKDRRRTVDSAKRNYKSRMPDRIVI